MWAWLGVWVRTLGDVLFHPTCTLLPLLFWTVQCQTLNEQEDKFPNYAIIMDHIFVTE